MDENATRCSFLTSCTVVPVIKFWFFFDVNESLHFYSFQPSTVLSSTKKEGSSFSRSWSTATFVRPLTSRSSNSPISFAIMSEPGRKSTKPLYSAAKMSWTRTTRGSILMDNVLQDNQNKDFFLNFTFLQSYLTCHMLFLRVFKTRFL